jgi:decaprenylphospho-beta-D-erythro-pentofuranosid-2-ulose 2-reductase
MTVSKKRIVIIGATSAIAEHCARLWVAQGPVDLVLIGRNQEKTDVIANDLRIRNPACDTSTIVMDFLNENAINSVVSDVFNVAPVDIVLIAHGNLPDQQQCQQDIVLAKEAISVNGVSPILFAEACAQQMEKKNTGVLAVIGSVAGDRGRKSNYVYGAAKGLVERYMQGLDHRFAKTNVRTVLIKPGPTSTPMTQHLQEAGARLATVESVAKNIVDGIAAGNTVIYAPKKWALIMLIIKSLPRFIFNKMDI